MWCSFPLSPTLSLTFTLTLSLSLPPSSALSPPPPLTSSGTHFGRTRGKALNTYARTRTHWGAREQGSWHTSAGGGCTLSLWGSFGLLQVGVTGAHVPHARKQRQSARERRRVLLLRAAGLGASSCSRVSLAAARGCRPARQLAVALTCSVPCAPSCVASAGQALNGDVSRYFDRFFLGGPLSLRGFRSRGVGPVLGAVRLTPEI